MLNTFIHLMEKRMIPDSLIRMGIRKLCQDRIQDESLSNISLQNEKFENYLEGLRMSPLAEHTKAANEQHYELPSGFFKYALGKNLKYSSCYFLEGDNLDQAEDRALAATMERAAIEDGMRVLELGCGWGSLTLALAAKFPRSPITAISNSSSQKEFIDGEAKKRGLNNITIFTKDVSLLEDFTLGGEKYDRVVSVEMFEHFKNYELLLKRISQALNENGKLFVHIFTHKNLAYPYVTEGEDNWMARYFFTGGQMPSHHLLYTFQKDLVIDRSWVWDGTHYQKTSEAWLSNMDKNEKLIMPLFKETYGDQAKVWFQRWRVFFLSCAEFFGYDNGQQWGVSHYLFSKR